MKIEHVLTTTHAASATVASAISSHRVLRNTYALLSVTLAFSAVVAGATAAAGLSHPGIVATLLGYFGLLFITTKLRNSAWGLLAVFGLTGFMGYTLGPIVSHYLSMPNGQQVVMMAFGGTATTFLGLSMYAISSRRDFSFLGGFLVAGVLVAFLAGLAAVLLQVPTLSLTVSAAFVLLMSGLVLFETSRIVNGGETNYIMATVGLYVAIFNLFTSLMHLIGFGSGSD